jgi:selenocysteine lyase/cysteine desulfurase
MLTPLQASIILTTIPGPINIFRIIKDYSMFNLRRHFMLDPSVTFLNHGSFGATPKPVFNEYQRWQRELEGQPVEFLGRRFTGLMAESRAALGEYLSTHADNLVYTQNVTISMNIVAHSLGLGAGDEVLSSDHEYGAMDRTWRFLAKERDFTYINQPVSLASKEAFVDSVGRHSTHSCDISEPYYFANRAYFSCRRNYQTGACSGHYHGH